MNMESGYKALKFARRMAFGLTPEAIPADPVAWAQAQLNTVPHIDILDSNGAPDKNRSPETKLLRTIPEVMTAYRNNWNVVDQMFALPPELPQAQRKAFARKTIFYPYRDLEHWKELQARLSTALYGPQPVFERFWHFWSNHLMVAPNTDNNDTTVGPYQRALRDHMTGSFRDLLWNAVTHPAMLIYLDNYRNVGPNSAARRQGRTKDSVNENLGRELLELFTLSPSAGYSQADVEHATLILTGWTFAMPNSNQAKPIFPSQNAPASMHGTVFAYARHEPGDQKVMGKVYSSSLFRQKGKLEDLITDLALHPVTARHLARKLCVYFIDDDPAPSAIEQVEKVFLESKGHLPSVHKAVVQVAWEQIDNSRKFQNPEAWLVQTLRLLDVPLPSNPPSLISSSEPNSSSLMRDLGQALPYSPQPNGWPIRSDEWISKELLDRRLRTLQLFVQKSPLITAQNSHRLKKIIAVFDDNYLGRLTTTMLAG
jgi:uncharacterized protein (DUF1800 family)